MSVELREFLGYVATAIAYDLEVGEGKVTRACIEVADALERRENSAEYLSDLACSQVDNAIDDLLACLNVPTHLMRSQV